MSVLGIHDAVIRDAEDEHFIWWTEVKGLILRFVSTAVMNFTVPPVRAILVDRSGHEVPDVSYGPPDPHYHYAFRFFRLAQVTEDLFDAYRNMYIAFELIISHKYPITMEKKRETG